MPSKYLTPMIGTARPLPLPVVFDPPAHLRSRVATNTKQGVALGDGKCEPKYADDNQNKAKDESKSDNAVYVEQNKLLRELRDARLARLMPKIHQVFIPDPGMTVTGTHVYVAERIGEQIGSQLWKTGARFLCDVLERLVISAEYRRAKETQAQYALVQMQR